MRCRSNLRGGGETMGLPRPEADPVWIGGHLGLPPTHARGGYPTWIIRSSRMMTPGRYLLVKLPLFFNISIITLHMSYLSLLAFNCTCHCPTRSGNPEIGSACYLDYPVKLDDDLRTPAGGDSPLTFPLRLLHGETCELLERMLQSAHNPITQPRYIRGWVISAIQI